MFRHAIRCTAPLLFAFAWLLPFTVQAADTIAPSEVPASGIVKVRSAYSVPETVARIRKDVASKGIMFFSEIDQMQLAANAGVSIRPSTLLTFGNPPLGTLFIRANALAGLDWPVRVLVLQEADGSVWVAWNDFAWIARRHHIGDRQQQFAMATSVVESITSTIRAR
jgi:uncharacterized protein (DUF302 family)